MRGRRAPRPPRDVEAERAKIESRTTERWVDEGSVRDAAEAATARAGRPTREPRAPKPLDPEVEARLVDAVGPQRGARLAGRLAQASEALDRERFDEARRVAAGIVKEAPDVAAAHEVVGLAAYRLGRFKEAIRALETAREVHLDPAVLPVLADSYRALRRWAAVDDVWLQLRQISPAPDVLAEGRIVAAGAQADRGDLRGAIDTMAPATKSPKRVRDHHLRQWYVLGDLHDRVGDPIAARRWFQAVAEHDPDFADVVERLRTLGR